MRPLFADPKTDFVFKRIFGDEEHKPLLIALLNGLLELDEAHRVVDVELLSPEQRPQVKELMILAPVASPLWAWGRYPLGKSRFMWPWIRSW